MIQKNFYDTVKLLKILFLCILLLGFSSRCLFIWSQGWDDDLWLTFGAFAIGIFFDMLLWAYFALPIVLWGTLPERLRHRPAFIRALFIVFLFEVGTLGFAILCEQFFIEEFHARYNFIAVDYLVYSNEVLRNIWESYSVEWILPIYAIFIYGICRALFKLAVTRVSPKGVRGQLAAGILPVVLLAISLPFIREDLILEHLNGNPAEIAKNTIYTLLAAYYKNEIPYRKFYPTIESETAVRATRQLLLHDGKGENHDGFFDEDKNSPSHFIQSHIKERPLNVILVLMESMSARFMGVFGEGSGLTPNLDRFALTGLFFNRVYATGTRTVRGIEAITLSVPPTPGQSIVRRPESGGLFNIGTVFRGHGYVTDFIYGGRAIFDNMGEFFKTNGFFVFDQTQFSSNEKTFESAWGVCDEDLFGFAVRRADKTLKETGKPFFQIILTTSNHRPYTYPEGKIDIPSHSGRAGAIKYADYSIGRLIDVAKKKPWFKNTVFVFIADHNASVAGGSKILPGDYHIPLIFYSPNNIRPHVNSTLGSQIDLAPTLLGLLGFSYESKFFGHDLAKTQFERAFLATYQQIGLWEHDQLVILSPNRKIQRVRTENEKPAREETATGAGSDPLNDQQVKDTIAFYQTASDWYTERLLKEDSREVTRSNQGPSPRIPGLHRTNELRGSTHHD
jgi:phosphoglycerol transferase MdoB-like AlkP superfamily enzyme